MKKMLAALAAVIMVAAAVVVRSGLDDKQTEAERVQVLCARIIADACRQWQASGANVTVKEGDTSKPSADTIVIGPAVATGNLSTGDFDNSLTLVSSPLVIVSKRNAGLCPTGTLRCFVGLPGPLAVDKTPELGDDVKRALRSAADRSGDGDPDSMYDQVIGSGTEPTDGLTVGKIQNVGIPQAALLPEFRVGPAAKLVATPLKPPASVSIVGFVRSDAPADAKALLKDRTLTSALETDGWKKP